MREFHKWEKELPVQAACEKLVQVGRQEEACAAMLLLELREGTWASLAWFHEAELLIVRLLLG